MRKSIGVLVAFLGVLFVAAVALAVWAVIDVYSGSSAAQHANTLVQDARGGTHAAYLARPRGGAADRSTPGSDEQPAILLLHEWWGLNREITELAELLAREGYVVLAPDTFGGSVAESVPGAVLQAATASQEELSRRIDAAYLHLEQLSGVDPDRIATVGFCFGGTQSFLLGTRVSQLAAVALFYGRGLPADASAFGALRRDTPVFAAFGRADSFISVSDVRAFQSALERYGVPHSVKLYPGVGHAFVSAEAVRKPGTARQAWQELLSFLARSIGQGGNAPQRGPAEQDELGDQETATAL